MRITKILGKRWRTLVHWSRQSTELQSEMELHFEQLVREFRASGMNEKEARDAARREFGNMPLLEEDSRRSWGWTWLEDAWKDVAFGARLLRKSPGFTLTAVLSLGLGIGANTAIFGLMKQVMLDALPVREPQNLVNIYRSDLENPVLPSFSRPFLEDLQTTEGLPFEGFLATTGLGVVSMVTESGAEPVQVDLVSGNYHELLGVRPALGRLFTPEDDQVLGGHPVAVLSDHYWNRRFGRDPAVLNKTITLTGRQFTIVGVSAAGFSGLTAARAPDIQIPIVMAPYPPHMIVERGSWWLDVFGRLKPGVDPKAAGDSLLPLLHRNYEIANRTPENDYQRKVRESERMVAVSAMRGSGTPRTWKSALQALMGMAAAVLLLACVNIAHLLLARGSARVREHSVRAAIGASRGRLIRQQLTESLLLSVMGGALGVAMAYALGESLVSMIVTDRAHSTLRSAPDTWILGFNFGVAVLCGVLCGLIPALRASRPGLIEGIRGAAGAGVGRLAMRKILISAQVAISLVLLMGAGLFARTLANFRGMDIGFRPSRLLMFGLDPAGYAPERVFAFYEQVREQIAAIPGVEAAAVGRQRIVSGRSWGSGISVEGYTPPDGEADPLRDAVSAGYFSTIGMPLVAGREFDQSDRNAKVAIVNESFARKYFKGQNPLGRRVGSGGHTPDLTIIGVVKDAKYSRMREQPQPFWWVPYQQLEPDVFHAFMMYVRTRGEPDQITPAIRAAVASVDRSLAMFAVSTVETQLNDNIRVERALALLSMFFAGAAALLAAIGLFGVLAYSVTRREREIGIRMAVGAAPYQASWTVVREVAIFVAIGLAAGFALAWQAGSLFESFLFGVTSQDGVSLAIACGGMALIAVLSASLPAWRAAKLPPSVVFRSE